MRVVLCDDHTLFTEALATQLESRGHEVVAIVASPLTLIGIVRDTGPDCVLLDLSFPQGSGLDAARELRETGSAVRVVLCTGETAATITATNQPVRQALRSGLLDALVEKTADYPAIEAALLDSPGWQNATPVVSDTGFSRLTPREVDVLAALADGLGTKAAAERLGVAPSTVQAHLKSAMLRLDVRSRFDAVHLYVVASGQVPRYVPDSQSA